LQPTSLSSAFGRALAVAAECLLRWADVTDAFIGSRVCIQYDDQNESFARYLPVEGTVSRRCTATAGPTDWYLIDLAVPIDYAGDASPSGQLKQGVFPQVLVRSRWKDVRLDMDAEFSVFLLLVRNDQRVPADPIDIEEFSHVCWARCRILAAPSQDGAA